MSDIKQIIYSNAVIGENCEKDSDGEFVNTSCRDGFCDCDAITYDDEYLNLSTVNYNEQIICIADLGLWNGRKKGYLMVGRKLSAVLERLCDYGEVYSDGRNIRAEARHHDGTNYYLYRVFKPGVNECKLQDLIYDGKVEWEDILKYTNSVLPDVKKIYGW